MAARPRTLPAAAAPVLVGAALAWRDGGFQFLPALAALLISLLLQIGANFANDLFDHERGADPPERLGPTRVTSTGLLAPAQVRLGMAVIFGSAALLGLYLALRAGWPVIALGLAAILAALAYTGGPRPYGYHALGDLFVFLFFGPAAVCGTYYVQAQTLTPAVWLASIPVGLLIVNILVVNNVRDIPTDTLTGKRTLAVLIGRRNAEREYLLCLLLAYALPPLAWSLHLLPWGGWLAWASIPLAIQQYREFRHSEGRSLNSTLAGAARLALVYALLFSVGIAIT